ncbi:MAG TPA: hypothetical protein VFL16_15275 [Steroidobacteraceae bacterium]|nr:hypothetical protein [Steroidobacteraceae bacterium]
MRWITLAATAALAITSPGTPAASPKRPIFERSPDVLQPQQAKPAALRAPLSIAAPLSGGATAMAAPTVGEVGDPDSFGRAVTYLGLTQTLPVLLIDDCSGSDPTIERCIVNQPVPLSTAFSEADLATMTLPGKATKSILCFTLTPFIDVSWQNPTASTQVARFTATADITIDNEVLDDPALIDPGTGLPFGGSLSLGLSTWHNTHSMAPGEFEDERSTQTRACIAGLLSKRNLVEGYGLTDAQATQFFKKPMTIHFGAHGSAQLSQLTQYFYGIRLYGD